MYYNLFSIVLQGIKYPFKGFITSSYGEFYFTINQKGEWEITVVMVNEK